MAAITNFEVYEQETGVTPVANSPYAMKEIIVVTSATADTADTIAVTLADYGMTTLRSIVGWTHTTDNSIVVEEAPTTSVTTGVLTITIGGVLTANEERVYLVGGI